MQPKYSSIAAIQTSLHSGATTCRAVVEYYLSQIERHRDLNAYIEVYAEEALSRADALDARFRENPAGMGRLFGAVLSIKDNICYAGHGVSAGAKILEGFVSLYSSTAVERILAEDAIIIGRTNCDQFGMGSSNENSAYGPVQNGFGKNLVPGGSSGGAAVSVQMDTCIAALASDTGGSIRQPAAFCGIWGLKPTYGRVSRHGLVAYGSSFDQIGPLAHNPDDMALIIDIIAGPDEYDSTAVAAPWPATQAGQRPLKIAYFREAIDTEGMEKGVREATLAFMQRLKDLGHQLEPVGFEYLDYIIPTYYVLTTAEASSNLARFDGIRYGYRSPQAGSLEETYLLSRTEGFSAEVKRRILLGTFVLSSGYYDAYYTKAQQARQLIRRRTLAILDDCDFILMPASPTMPWRFGEKTSDPVAMYLSDIFTVSAGLAGVPAIALPAGTEPESGLPIGIQFMAKPWEEPALLAFARTLV